MEGLSRRQLQALAKKHGIEANSKSAVLRKRLQELQAEPAVDSSQKLLSVAATQLLQQGEELRAKVFVKPAVRCYTTGFAVVDQVSPHAVSSTASPTSHVRTAPCVSCVFPFRLCFISASMPPSPTSCFS